MPEWLRGQTRNLMGFARVGSNPAANEVQVGWPSGLRRQFQALVSSEAWVRIPLQSRFFLSVRPSFLVVRAVIFLGGAKKIAETGNRTQASAATMQGTAIILSRRESFSGRCGAVVAPWCNAGAHSLPNDRHLSKAVNASAS